ncbi:Kinesin- protein 11 [Podochytrium sp. JEL0797]|nr:Kinesin- protein 11 [Podochytrium sp. JEL0797]
MMPRSRTSSSGSSSLSSSGPSGHAMTGLQLLVPDTPPGKDPVTIGSGPLAAPGEPTGLLLARDPNPRTSTGVSQATSSTTTSNTTSTVVNTTSNNTNNTSTTTITTSNAQEHAVKVFLRLRSAPAALPRVVHRLPDPHASSIAFRPIVTAQQQTEKEPIFTFDAVFPENEADEKVFRTVALPLLSRIFEPARTDELIMAYGPSGTGKTHTLDRVLEKSIRFLINEMGAAGRIPGTVGITPKGWDEIEYESGKKPHRADVMEPSNDGAWSLWISFVEIYNDKCYDLLRSQEQAQKFGMMNGNPVVKNLVEVQIHDHNQAMDLVRKVNGLRTTSETKVNRTSSRGHLITTLKVIKLNNSWKEPPKISRIAIADLAGSESSKRTGTSGVALKEAGQINQSLMHLSECVKAMVKIQEPPPTTHRTKSASSSSTITTTTQQPPIKIFYRNCKLTMALFPFFRNGLVTFVFHVNPTNEEQTRMALDFSQQSCQLVTFHPLVLGLGKAGTGGRGGAADADERDAIQKKAFYERELLRLKNENSTTTRLLTASRLRVEDLERDYADLVEKNQLMTCMNESEEERWRSEYLALLGKVGGMKKEWERESEERFAGQLEMNQEKIEEMADELEQKDVEYSQLRDQLDAKESEMAALEEKVKTLEALNESLNEQPKNEFPPAVECWTCESFGEQISDKDHQIRLVTREKEAEAVAFKEQLAAMQQALSDALSECARLKTPVIQNTAACVQTDSIESTDALSQTESSPPPLLHTTTDASIEHEPLQRNNSNIATPSPTASFLNSSPLHDDRTFTNNNNDSSFLPQTPCVPAPLVAGAGGIRGSNMYKMEETAVVRGMDLVDVGIQTDLEVPLVVEAAAAPCQIVTAEVATSTEDLVPTPILVASGDVHDAIESPPPRSRTTSSRAATKKRKSVTLPLPVASFDSSDEEHDGLFIDLADLQDEDDEVVDHDKKKRNRDSMASASSFELPAPTTARKGVKRGSKTPAKKGAKTPAGKARKTPGKGTPGKGNRRKAATSFSVALRAAGSDVVEDEFDDMNFGGVAGRKTSLKLGGGVAATGVRRRSSSRAAGLVEMSLGNFAGGGSQQPVLSQAAPVASRKARTLMAALQAGNRKPLDLLESSTSSKATNLSMKSLSEILGKGDASSQVVKGRKRAKVSLGRGSSASDYGAVPAVVVDADTSVEGLGLGDSDGEVGTGVPRKTKRLRSEKTFMPPLEDSPAPARIKKRRLAVRK